MGYSRAEMEAELEVIDMARHLTRKDLLDKVIDGFRAKRILDKLDDEERRCRAKMGASVGKFVDAQRRAAAEVAKSPQARKALGQAILTQIEREKPATFRHVSQARAKK